MKAMMLLQKHLQKEVEEDCGVTFTGRIKDKNKREKLNYRKGFEADPNFLQIWEKIKFHTKYNVAYQTSDLITLAAKAMKEMVETKKPSVTKHKE
jgi:type III restriction enzyme